MNALHYVNGIRTKVCEVNGHEFLSFAENAQRLTFCTISSVFIVHTGTPEVIYYDGFTEAEVNDYYTMLLAPYSHIADNKDDNDIFVDAANVHLYNFAKRLKAYLQNLTSV